MALKYRVITMSLLLGLGLIVSFNAHADSIEETKIKFFNDEILKKITTVCNAIAKTKKIDFVNQLIQSNDIELVEANTTYYVFKSSAILAQNNRERIKNEINKDCKAANDKAFADAEARRQAALQGASSPSGSGSTSSGSSGSSSAGGIGGSGLGINDVIKAGKALERLEKSKEAKNKTGGQGATSNSDSKAENGASGLTPAVDAAIKSAGDNLKLQNTAGNLPSDIGTDENFQIGLNTLDQDEKASLNKMLTEYKSEAESLELAKAKKELPDEAQAAAKDIGDQSKAKALDQEALRRDKLSNELIELMKTKLDALNIQIDNAKKAAIVATAETCLPLSPYSAYCAPSKLLITSIEKEHASLKLELEKMYQSQKKCSDDAIKADNFCSFIRNDQIQDVQTLVSVGFTLISSTSSASKTCGLTSSLSKVAQGGMLLAQLMCTTNKLFCDSSCKSAKAILDKMLASNKKILSLATQMWEIPRLSVYGEFIQGASAGVDSVLVKELQVTAPVPSSIVQCQNHKASIITMGSQIAGLALAIKDAKACKNQLSAGNGSGSETGNDGKKAVTTAEFCAKPENVSSIACKCYLNPKDSACAIQAIANGASKDNQAEAGSRPNSFLGGRTGTNSGVSAFAGSTNGSDGSSDNAVVGKNKNDGSESSASSNLNNSGAVSALSGSSLLSGSDNQAGGSSAGTVPSESSSSSKDKNSSDELARGNNTTTSGFSFSALKSSLGSFFGSGSAPAKKPVKISESRQKELEQAVKRKIASEQFRSEVTTANGNSNFEKVSNKYRSQQQSFLNEE